MKEHLDVDAQIPPLPLDAENRESVRSYLWSERGGKVGSTNLLNRTCFHQISSSYLELGFVTDSGLTILSFAAVSPRIFMRAAIAVHWFTTSMFA